MNKEQQQDLIDAIDMLIQHVQSLADSIEKLTTEINWANSHRKFEWSPKLTDDQIKELVG